MKTSFGSITAAVMAAAGLILTDATAAAQTLGDLQPAATSSAAPQLPYGVSPILQLAQAKVGDDTIISYIKNSGNSYGLNADQIIYLRQQGVSEAVITAMLNQPRPGVATPTTPAAQPATISAAAPATPAVATAPTVTYVQTVPATTYYYYQPYCYPRYYYPAYNGCYYGWPYPAVSLSFGWGGHWGGWHGGWGGRGWHR